VYIKLNLVFEPSLKVLEHDKIVLELELQGLKMRRTGLELAKKNLRIK
jgi:hypothetical protein